MKFVKVKRVSKCYPLSNLKKIKMEAIKGRSEYVCVKVNSRTALIPRDKYGESWWRKAKESDLRRVLVY